MFVFKTHLQWTVLTFSCQYEKLVFETNINNFLFGKLFFRLAKRNYFQLLNLFCFVLEVFFLEIRNFKFFLCVKTWFFQAGVTNIFLWKNLFWGNYKNFLRIKISFLRVDQVTNRRRWIHFPLLTCYVFIRVFENKPKNIYNICACKDIHYWFHRICYKIK